MPTTYEMVKIVPSNASGTPAVGTNNGAGVDTLGSETIMIYINAGVVTDGSHAFTVEESDVQGSGYTQIPAGARISPALPTITNANGSQGYEIGVTPLKRFVRVVITRTGGATGGTMGSAVVVAGPDVFLPLH